ncbi:hypothetical protein M407DRAFT_187587 [Tulasnella calospora MUT 4182]|uniref:Uncharacterized protein n=1 Tax=Tulasnella calospora MUT 4182 TaxID=1051891 RepID=A0A0C3L2J6_9AGAM|nr:hypothetical protein M407DRAFT_187587 [Tulasnella calospora MUT 4182]
MAGTSCGFELWALLRGPRDNLSEYLSRVLRHLDCLHPTHLFNALCLQLGGSSGFSIQGSMLGSEYSVRKLASHAGWALRLGAIEDWFDGRSSSKASPVRELTLDSVGMKG